MKMNFQLNISEAEYLRFYQGSARDVIVMSTEGRTIKFPANLLRDFVAHDGIHGYFEIEFDAQFRFKSLIRLEPE